MNCETNVATAEDKVELLDEQPDGKGMAELNSGMEDNRNGSDNSRSALAVWRHNILLQRHDCCSGMKEILSLLPKLRPGGVETDSK